MNIVVHGDGGGGERGREYHTIKHEENCPGILP